MKIGEKIKNMRVAKMMTQSELACDVITRNMLSRIENDAALPSLPTLLHIAGKLNVPAGYLIADEDNEFIYRKIRSMNNIRCAYVAKNFRLCRNICIDELSDADDEIFMILAECSYRVGREEMDEGRLHSACAYFDEALENASKTVYNTASLRSQIYTCFRYLTDRISGTLYSKHDIVSDIYFDMLAVEDDFCRYALTIESISQEGRQILESTCKNFNSLDPSYASHVEARMLMSEGRFSEATEVLNNILRSDISVSRHILYLVVCDLEICSKEICDYKSAYEFSTSKLTLLESMLSEVFET